MSCPDGKCGRHRYVNITQSKVSAIIAQLKASGASVTGESPQWIVDTHQSGVVLCGAPRKTSLPENPAYKNQRLTEPILQKSGVFRGALWLLGQRR